MIKSAKKSYFSNITKFCFSSLKINQSKFKFSPITQKQLQICIPGVASSFAQAQPDRTLGLTKQLYLDFLKCYMPACLKRGISNIVRDKQTDQILGCSIITDTYDQEQISFSKLDMNKFGPLFELLKITSQQYLQTKNAFFTQGVYAHSHFTAIFPQHKGQNIGRQLFMHQFKLCKQKGYKYIVRQTTNHGARKVVLQKLNGSQELKYTKYSDFVYNGQKILKNTPHGVSLIVSYLNQIK